MPSYGIPRGMGLNATPRLAWVGIMAMRQRQLGNSGIMASEVGFGGAPLSGYPVKEAAYLLEEALDRGCSFFDTAPGYGRGRNEVQMGDAFRGKRDRVVLCTKYGMGADGATRWEVDGIRPSVEASLGRLRTDHVDVLLFHNPPAAWLQGDHPAHAVLEELKEASKIRAYGSSLDWGSDLETLAGTSKSQAAELLLNIFHQEPARAFPLVEQAGMGLIIKVPLDSGWLTGKYDAMTTFTDGRSRWSTEQVSRRARLVDGIRFVTDDGTTMVQAALRFLLKFPQVTTVIPGVRNIEQLEANLSATDGEMPDAVFERLRRFHEEEIGDNPVPW